MIERDRVLVALHQQVYGDRVAGSAACGRCSEPFDLDFSLEALVASVLEDAADPPGPDGVEVRGREVFVEGVVRCRLPVGADEVAVAHLDPEAAEQALLERCSIDGTAIEVVADALDRVEAVTPIISMTLDAAWPECGAEQPVHFDLQSHVLGRLSVERQRLMGEIHRLAGSYRWGWSELLGLTREERRAQVDLLVRAEELSPR